MLWNRINMHVHELIQYFKHNHNYNKILKSDWLSTALISALIGQFNRTVRVMPKYAPSRARLNARKKKWNFLCFDFKKGPFISQTL